MVLINFPHKTSSRIPYIPSLNSKAALFMILSLSSAPGDLGLSLSASSWVTVNLYENRLVCQTVSQLFMPSVSLWVCFSIHLYCIVSSFILVIQSAWIHNDSRQIPLSFSGSVNLSRSLAHKHQEDEHLPLEFHHFPQFPQPWKNKRTSIHILWWYKTST